MENSLYLDFHMFLTAIYGGLIAGLIYDISRTLRNISKGKKYITYIQDLVFWVIVTILFFYILIKINWGEIRGFIVLGFIFGIIIYIKTFSKFIYPILMKIFGFIIELIKVVISYVFFPFRFIKSKISKPLIKVKKIPKEILKDTKKYKKIISSKK